MTYYALGRELAVDMEVLSRMSPTTVVGCIQSPIIVSRPGGPSVRVPKRGISTSSNSSG